MFTTLKNAFKIKDLRDKILFTLAMLIVIRIGSQLPVPGVNGEYFKSWFDAQSDGAFSFFDAITGGSFINMSILALNISPYITSSIIMQLLTIAIPKLEEMQRDGDDGRKKIASITRYVTIGLALIQSTAMAISFGRQGYLTDYAVMSTGERALSITCAVATLTAGSAFLMWIGERITERGIGNGISIVLVINIISRLPEDLGNLFQQFVFGKAPATAVLAVVIIFAVIVAMVLLVIILNDGVRRIPVQYANKVQGRKMVGGQTSNIPLKVNTAGVIPVIFAQSLLQLPIIISSFTGYSGTGVWGEILKYMNSSYWCRPEQLKYTVGLLVYIVLIVLFAYFYTSITFNPLMIADNMKKQGGFIPGIRPGKPTSDYLNKVLNYIVFIGAIGLTIIAVLPYFFSGVFNANVSFGGTSLIIIVSVVLETMKQVESQMLVRNYKGFLEK
ncbi:preprotein translocase subunit SecY [Acetatifactor muris]|uniref:Protein translocase subunit SecY n=1 Tax=Acetatifactor muris TaxID=879566 RepID=A0A2K4ZCS7_9FIRM|nr:preprotein translocase subunit SecY [Acetatifactor muris]MCI8799690.1 preprotein translocase subunit SecY [Lachnospiraceae bacterium]MCR2046662.1 preprotein translocase subunit SecY [Acetatifactor muris]SOY28254.1 preprotein translocase subunit SecY [Acetatifactor muris]